MKNIKKFEGFLDIFKKKKANNTPGDITDIIWNSLLELNSIGLNIDIKNESVNDYLVEIYKDGCDIDNLIFVTDLEESNTFKLSSVYDLVYDLVNFLEKEYNVDINMFITHDRSNGVSISSLILKPIKIGLRKLKSHLKTPYLKIKISIK